MLSELKAYHEKLEEELQCLLTAPVTCQSMKCVDEILEHCCVIKETIDHLCLSDDDSIAWVNEMMNEDGTKGPHWSVAETSGFKRSSVVSESSWNATMNMMYSDYYKVAEKYGLNRPDFYADLAEAFLNDKDADSGEAKLAQYYYGIVG